MTIFNEFSHRGSGFPPAVLVSLEFYLPMHAYMHYTHNIMTSSLDLLELPFPPGTYADMLAGTPF